MALTPDVDSYVTVVEADAYFAAHFGYDEWAGLQTETKEQLLRSAVPILDHSCSWFEKKCADDQPLAFPRQPDCVTPQGVKDAQCELAYLLYLKGGPASQDAAENPLKRMKAGGVEMEWHDRISSVDAMSSGLVSQLLGQYGFCSQSGSTRTIPVGRA